MASDVCWKIVVGKRYVRAVLGNFSQDRRPVSPISVVRPGFPPERGESRYKEE
jgi:hypothetical protein